MKKWQKILTICLVSLVGALTIATAVTLGILNYSADTCGEVEIINDGQNYYALTKAVNGYNGYRFRFKTDDSTLSVDSKNNMLDLSTVNELVPNQEYSISACYLGEIGGGNSRYGSSVTWRAEFYLAKPNISIEDDGTLRWQPVKNADHYVVHLGVNTFTILDNQVNLPNLKCAGGIYNIWVTAHSSLSYYKSSTSVQLENVTIKHIFHTFSSVTLANEGEQKVLKIRSDEIINKIDVQIGDEVSQFEVEAAQEGNDYVYTINIAYIYRSGVEIGARASQINQYNLASETVFIA